MMLLAIVWIAALPIGALLWYRFASHPEVQR